MRNGFSGHSGATRRRRQKRRLSSGVFLDWEGYSECPSLTQEDVADVLVVLYRFRHGPASDTAVWHEPCFSAAGSPFDFEVTHCHES